MNQLSYNVCNDTIESLGSVFPGRIESATTGVVKLVRNTRTSSRRGTE